MKRVIVCILDSFGIGGAPDAAAYDDNGADTLGHIAKNYPLHIPNLLKNGLGEAYFMCNGRYPQGFNREEEPDGAYTYASEQSIGKDTPSGHWELMGLPVTTPWSLFPKEYPSFPPDILEKIAKEVNIDGFLGNYAASGTEILKELGEKHLHLLSEGKALPIVYTSADSVMQIAAHEELFGLERLYRVCQKAREIMDDAGYMLGRVIARPFLGETSATFKRTPNRHDYSLPPPSPTILEYLVGQGKQITGIGKIYDIFAGKGITKKILASGNEDIFSVLVSEIKNNASAAVILANFVDFDMLYGHRRDIKGYAKALEYFDSCLPKLKEAMRDDDILIITADHGCDPDFKGVNHTRECIPVLISGKNIQGKSLPPADSFCIVAKVINQHLAVNYSLSN